MTSRLPRGLVVCAINTDGRLLMRRPLTFVHEVFKHDLYTLMLAADRRLNAGFVLLLQWSSRHTHYCLRRVVLAF